MPTKSSDGIVMHVDMDCFYAACERLRNPELEEEAVVIGMGFEEGETTGAVATASYEAREHGVESAQPISKAVDLLPPRKNRDESRETAIYLPVDIDFYEEVSEEVIEVLEGYANVVRRVSIDEAYLDVTQKTNWSKVEDYASRLKQEIQREVGVTASIGVAPNMNAAKIASDHDKPDGLLVLKPGEVRKFLEPLDVIELHGIGPKTAEKLREMGVDTVGDLAEMDVQVLRERFGKKGQDIYLHARGEDDREVEPMDPPKSLLKAKAFEPTDEINELRERLLELASKVVGKARQRDALYKTIGIMIILTPFERVTREKTLSVPIDEIDIVEEVVLELFEEFRGSEIRKLGVRLSNLEYSDLDQQSLGDWNHDSESSDDEDSEGFSVGQSDLSDF